MSSVADLNQNDLRLTASLPYGARLQDGVNFDDVRTLMTAALVAFFAVGFFAATLLPLFRFLVLIMVATLVVAVIACLESMPAFHVLGLSAASLALAQVGYGLGLAWAASMGPRCVGD